MLEETLLMGYMRNVLNQVLETLCRVVI